MAHTAIALRLDENLSPTIAEAALALGVDVLAASGRGTGASDEDQLRWAAEEGRVLITADRGDFQSLSVRFAEEGLPHAGVVLLPRPPQSRESHSVAQAIARFAAMYPDGVPPYFTSYLPRDRRP
jgi:hypothetical protein